MNIDNMNGSTIDASEVSLNQQKLSVKEMFDLIAQDKKLDGNDLIHFQKLEQQFLNEKNDLHEETKEGMQNILKLTLEKGYSVNTIEDYQVLESMAKILDYTIPTYDGILSYIETKDNVSQIVDITKFSIQLRDGDLSIHSRLRESDGGIIQSREVGKILVKEEGSISEDIGRKADQLRNNNKISSRNVEKYLGVDRKDIQEGEIITLEYKGGTYTGTWEQGKPHGKGEIVYKNGDTFSGEFVDGKKEGNGILIEKGGTQHYEGDFKGDKKEGKGLYHFNDNMVYEGEFKNNKLTGTGILIDGTSGLVKRGDFVNGVLEKGYISDKYDSFVGAIEGKKAIDFNKNPQELERARQDFILSKEEMKASTVVSDILGGMTVSEVEKIPYIKEIKEEENVKNFYKNIPTSHIKIIQEIVGVEVDGAMGNNTLNAIKKYQKDNNLTPDGLVGNNTFSVMKEKFNIIQLNQKVDWNKKNISQEGRELLESVLGIQEINADSIGKIEAFQKENNLETDGKCGKNTLMQLKNKSLSKIKKQENEKEEEEIEEQNQPIEELHSNNEDLGDFINQVKNFGEKIQPKIASATIKGLKNLSSNESEV